MLDPASTSLSSLMPVTREYECLVFIDPGRNGNPLCVCKYVCMYECTCVSTRI